VAMRVSPNSNLSGKTIAENGISNVPGVYVVDIERPVVEGNDGVVVISTGSPVKIGNLRENDGRKCRSIDPDEPLEDGDILWFAGGASAIGDLRKIPGLESHEEGEINQMQEHVHDRRLVQAVVARSGPLVGKTVREVAFRTTYGAAVISVHRNGNRIHDHPANIKLHAGDVLLLEAGPTFFKRTASDHHIFALLAEVQDSAPPRLRYLVPAVVIVVTMLAVYTAEVASLLVCALMAAILMVAIGLLSEHEVRDAVDWPLFVAIAAAFGISNALTNSGVAQGVANFLLSIGNAIGIGGESFGARSFGLVCNLPMGL
jgi:TrkA-C domain